MESSELLTKAITLACQVHQNQFDKAGEPYILHPLRVMNNVEGGNMLKIVAVLHDVIEDSDGAVTFKTLQDMGFPPSVVSAVDALSKRNGESYQDFIIRVSENAWAIKVKIADLEDNMNLKRLSEITDKDLARYKKYHEAYKFLMSKLSVVRQFI